MASKNSGHKNVFSSQLNPNASEFVSRYPSNTVSEVKEENLTRTPANQYRNKNKITTNTVVNNNRPVKFHNQRGRGRNFNRFKSGSSDWRENCILKSDQDGKDNNINIVNNTTNGNILHGRNTIPNDNFEARCKGKTTPKTLGNIFQKGEAPKGKIGCKKSAKKVMTSAVNSTEGQREMLEDELRDGRYECMVCCGVVGRRGAVWSCACCSHVFHLKCVQKWAASPNSQVLPQVNDANELNGADNAETDAFGDAVGDGVDGSSVGSVSTNNDGISSNTSNNSIMTFGDLRISNDDSWVNATDSSKSDRRVVGSVVSWRCPSCQNVTSGVPEDYLCFCGKQCNPPFSAYLVPHSCGEVCGRIKGSSVNPCTHPCTLLCHPGPCPPCNAFTVVRCLCGKTSTSLKCSQAKNIRCTESCGRTLNCGSHHCILPCHAAPCTPCGEVVEQRCCCGKGVRRVLCGSALSFESSFRCGVTCGKKLTCTHHSCPSPCHPGPCKPCVLLPLTTTHCPCGKVALTQLGGSVRRSCVDAVACCGGVCEKELPCGEEGKRHKCPSKCHQGDCPACGGVMKVECRCGATMREVACEEVVKVGGGKTDGAKDGGNDRCEDNGGTVSVSEMNVRVMKDEEGRGDEVRQDVGGVRGNVGESMAGGVGRGGVPRCDTRCGRRLSCRRHKCLQNCCVDQVHQCKMICGYKLACGLHKCTDACHQGRCQQCWNTSFEELRCHCGAEVIYPPIPCGTEAPPCERPCTREHQCDHPVLHPCHSAPTCPPCTALVERPCLCGKEVRRNVACYLTEVLCGLPCSKAMHCMVHYCLKTCHKGPCSKDTTCTQPCPFPRPKCGHPCSLPCHVGHPCPPGVCHYEIVGECMCGRKRQGKMLCLIEEKTERSADYSTYEANKVAAALWRSQSASLLRGKEAEGDRRISCDEVCEKGKRNRRLAEALGVGQNRKHTDQSSAKYSEFVLEYARKNSKFAKEVESVLTELVDSMQKQTTRKNHDFKPMSLQHRRFIHELAPLYGCQTNSHDTGALRSVVVTASKFYSKVPAAKIEKFLKEDAS